MRIVLALQAANLVVLFAVPLGPKASMRRPEIGEGLTSVMF